MHQLGKQQNVGLVKSFILVHTVVCCKCFNLSISTRISVHELFKYRYFLQQLMHLECGLNMLHALVFVTNFIFTLVYFLIFMDV